MQPFPCNVTHDNIDIRHSTLYIQITPSPSPDCRHRHPLAKKLVLETFCRPLPLPDHLTSSVSSTPHSDGVGGMHCSSTSFLLLGHIGRHFNHPIRQPVRLIVRQSCWSSMERVRYCFTSLCAFFLLLSNQTACKHGRRKRNDTPFFCVVVARAEWRFAGCMHRLEARVVIACNYFAGGARL